MPGIKMTRLGGINKSIVLETAMRFLGSLLALCGDDSLATGKDAEKAGFRLAVLASQQLLC
jgi:hypothetical protein